MVKHMIWRRNNTSRVDRSLHMLPGALVTLKTGQQLRICEEYIFLNNLFIFHLSSMLWPFLESSLWDDSNEWSQHEFSLRRKKVRTLEAHFIWFAHYHSCYWATIREILSVCGKTHWIPALYLWTYWMYDFFSRQNSPDLIAKL